MFFEVLGLDHVQIAVPRALERDCVAFYRRLFAESEVEKPEALRQNGGAWFQLPNFQLHIGIDPEASPASKRHICLRVADAETARANLVAAGITVELSDTAQGIRRFFIRDPAGNRIEIGQRPDAG